MDSNGNQKASREEVHASSRDAFSIALELNHWLREGGRLWLFLDYDGTLAGFAPNPDVILPDPALIDLIARLAGFRDNLRVVILSGRRLEHIAKLLPVPGILLAGTYGIELQDFDGNPVPVVGLENERPLIEQVKAQWSDLLKGHDGFYLEDKGYAIAIHAKFAPDTEAHAVIETAAGLAGQAAEKGALRILGGNKFIEVAPVIADKGQSVTMLLERFPWPGAKMVYIGDDDKDEEAFKVIKDQGGLAVVVARSPRPTLAEERLENPEAVRLWLEKLTA